MSKVNLLCCLMPILVIVILPGCKGHSIVDFENPELPSTSLPNEVSQEIRKRYSVDGVFVAPLIRHSRLENEDSGYEVRIEAFYQEAVEIEIKKLSLTRDGEPIVLESPFSDSLMDDFRYNNSYQAYYAYINSPPFSITAPEDTKKLHVILNIEVKKGDGTTKSGTVEATFEPRKRTYYFPQA
ncbi:MAG: hypothetical protein FVQ84_18515 [Planctomycetes bacterium]|nr:hypothetical protein [Planctomycetota bacterium]